MNISPDGTILKTLFDTTGTAVPETGTVKEKDGYLYFGGDVAPFIGKYKLEDAGVAKVMRD